ncbi:MAG: phosphate ABC transporter permease subunit PstC [Proteobacteria bacterium]|jgi:phosphate transport system permease protein|nr:phosphate ABC transporter permease subunit PstC [Pseudomonadota bacterium]
MIPSAVTNIFSLTVVLFLTALIVFFIGKSYIVSLSQAQGVRPHSLRQYYGIYAAAWTFVPAILVLLMWTALTQPVLTRLSQTLLLDAYPNIEGAMLQLRLAQLQNISTGLISASDDTMRSLADAQANLRANANDLKFVVSLLVAFAGAIFAIRQISPEQKARIKWEGFLRRLFFVAAVVAILTTVGIVSSLLYESIRFFSQYSMIDFFFGTHWSPLKAFSSSGGQSEVDGVTQGSFGMLPVMAGTLLVAFIAMMVAVPVGLFAAIYMAEFASERTRNIVKPALEVLAGVPTVVYGFFAALTVGPFIRDLGLFAGLDISAQSALAAGGVMGIMIIPFISSLSDDVITAVPRSLRDGALGLGSTRGEMITKVVLPAAFPGLIGAFLLAISRAIGETMIVVMAAGVSAQLTINPLDSVTTVTVQIVMLLTGDTEFDSLKTLSAFALGITLFVITLMLNMAALSVSRRMGGRYE